MDAGKGLGPSSFIQSPNCGSGCACPREAVEHTGSRLERWGWSQNGASRTDPSGPVPSQESRGAILQSPLPAQGSSADKYPEFPHNPSFRAFGSRDFSLPAFATSQFSSFSSLRAQFSSAHLSTVMPHPTASAPKSLQPTGTQLGVRLERCWG